MTGDDFPIAASSRRGMARMAEVEEQITKVQHEIDAQSHEITALRRIMAHVANINRWIGATLTGLEEHRAREPSNPGTTGPPLEEVSVLCDSLTEMQMGLSEKHRWLNLPWWV
jgi:hypothetical protein